MHALRRARPELIKNELRPAGHSVRWTYPASLHFVRESPLFFEREKNRPVNFANVNRQATAARRTPRVRGHTARAVYRLHFHFVSLTVRFRRLNGNPRLVSYFGTGVRSPIGFSTYFLAVVVPNGLGVPFGS